MQYVALLARLNLSVAHCKIQNVWSNHSFNTGKKKALIKVFLRSFCSFNFTIQIFCCHHLTFLQISANFLQISIHLLQKLSSSSVLLWKTCCRLWSTSKSYRIFLRKPIFVATTLQQNQNNLILLQCFSNIFFFCF